MAFKPFTHVRSFLHPTRPQNGDGESGAAASATRATPAAKRPVRTREGPRGAQSSRRRPGLQVSGRRARPPGRHEKPAEFLIFPNLQQLDTPKRGPLGGAAHSRNEDTLPGQQ